jgi:hypothetical protein
MKGMIIRWRAVGSLEDGASIRRTLRIIIYDMMVLGGEGIRWPKVTPYFL